MYISIYLNTTKKHSVNQSSCKVPEESINEQGALPGHGHLTQCVLIWYCIVVERIKISHVTFLFQDEPRTRSQSYAEV
jgi:hypothetical protein